MNRYETATGHDPDRVEAIEGNQVRYWCESLGCTEAQLREAVAAVGHVPARVRQYLEELDGRGVF